VSKIVDFIDDYGKTRTGKLDRKITRGRYKGWFKVLSHENGHEKIFKVKHIRHIRENGEEKPKTIEEDLL
jgi:hypothetical protein